MGNGYNADPPIYWDGSGEVSKTYTQESNQSDVSQNWSQPPQQQQWSDYNYSIGGYYVYPDVHQPDYTGACQEGYYDPQYTSLNDMFPQDTQPPLDTMTPVNDPTPEKVAPKKKKTVKVLESTPSVEVDPTPEELSVLKLLDMARVEMTKEKSLAEQEKDETNEMKKMSKDRVDKERRKLEALRSSIGGSNDLEEQLIVETQRKKLRYVKDVVRAREEREKAPPPPPEEVERRRARWVQKTRLRYEHMTPEQRERKKLRDRASSKARQAKRKQEQAEKDAAGTTEDTSDRQEPIEPEREQQDDGEIGAAEIVASIY